ncbi:MAG: glucose-6-phosphate isomerase [Psychroflexus halocasei]
MTLPKKNLQQLKAWSELQNLAKTENLNIQDLFKNDSNRFEKYSLNFDDFLFDYSKHLISDKIKFSLLELANQAELKDAIKAQFDGDLINETENRAVLHTALRDFSESNSNNVHQSKDALGKMQNFVTKVHSGEWKTYADQKITDVVNIGIGGSDLGPQMVVDALDYYKKDIKCHFISNVDGDPIHSLLKTLNPETTLFVIVSKSFTTQETLTNANTIREWFLTHTSEENIKHNFVAVSTNLDAVEKFGIASDNIFPMFDWVGGRFSLWSTAGLSIALTVGMTHFKELLRGAEAMDLHFKETDFDKNIPVLSALISIWYNNFLDAESEAIIPYTNYLQKLAPYLQQASMESNGKSVDRNGDKINYQTGNIVWGEPGTNAQHAFFQLIHQGTKLIPADFIGFKKSLHQDQTHHDILMANYFAQTEALLKGKSKTEVEKELKSQGLSENEIEKLLPFKVFEGNKPTTSLLIDKLTPKSLGKLIAMYEHKIFVQGVIWNIFSFDQWGVQLGKELANKVLTDITSESVKNKHDQSTNALLRAYKNS